jgi:hypothetical protein
MGNPRDRQESESMERIVARVPESIEELCLVRLGLVARSLRAWPFAVRIGRSIERSAKEAAESGAGLLSNEWFPLGWGHFGVLQYWSSFDALDAWSHRPPHSEWWREALERMRKRGDFGIYHETFVVPRAGVESIYLNSPKIGLRKFGVEGEAVGSSTTSRDRLGRRAEKG